MVQSNSIGVIPAGELVQIIWTETNAQYNARIKSVEFTDLEQPDWKYTVVYEDLVEGNKITEIDVVKERVSQISSTKTLTISEAIALYSSNPATKKNKRKSSKTKDSVTQRKDQLKQDEYIGLKISKQFGEDWYQGEITFVHRLSTTKQYMFRIVYEDGDSEDLFWEEVQPLLIDPLPRAIFREESSHKGGKPSKRDGNGQTKKNNKYSEKDGSNQRRQVIQNQSQQKKIQEIPIPKESEESVSPAPEEANEEEYIPILAIAFGEYLDELVQQIEGRGLELRQGQQFDGPKDSQEEPESDSLELASIVSRAELTKLYREVVRVKDAGCLHQTPVDSVHPLLPILDKIVCAGQRVDLFAVASKKLEDGQISSIDAWANSKEAGKYFSLSLLSFEAAIIGLMIMSSPKVNPRVVLEDFQENCLNLLKHQLSKHVLPSIDPSKLGSGNADEDDAKDSKKGATFRSLTRNIMKQIAGQLTELIEQFEKLIEAIRLQDNFLLTISSSLLTLFVLETSTVDMISKLQPLQYASLGVLQAIFQKHEQHRQLIIEDIFGMVLRLPTGKRNLRTYSLHHLKDALGSKNNSIQMFTALVMFLVQCCILEPPKLQPSAEEDTAVEATNAPDSPTNREKSGYGALLPAIASSQLLLTHFLSRCRSKEKGSDFRPLLHNFVEDLLTVMFMPEWPAAETLLQILCRLLLKDLSEISPKIKEKDTNIHYFNMAVEILGKVCTVLRTHLKAQAERPISLPRAIALSDDQRNARPDQAGENSYCVCGRSVADTFMLDCDRCHRWFHGDCVGVSDKDDVTVWHCSDCDIQMKVEKQREHLALKRLVKAKASDPLKNLEMRGNSIDDEDAEMDGLSEYAGGLEERDVFRQLLLNHLSHRVRSEKRIIQARRFHIGRWLKETDTQCRPEIWEHFKDQWDLPKNKTFSDEELLQNETAIARLAQKLTCDRELCQSFNILLTHILALLGQQHSLLRAKVVKAVAEILQADPLLMADQIVQKSMIDRFRDKATTVRKEIVSLVGKYVLSHPNLLQTYHDPLMWCLVDDGISVRKTCVKIFRDILIMHPEYPRRSDICWKLVERASFVKETEAIKDLIRNTFQEIWFCEPRLTMDAPETKPKESVFVTPSGGVAHVPAVNLHLDPPAGETVTKGIVKGVAIGVSTIAKEFEGFGVFTGRIISYKKPYYLVQYEDGDEEEMPISEVKPLLRKSNKEPKKGELPSGWVTCPGKNGAPIFVSPQGVECHTLEEAWKSNQPSLPAALPVPPVLAAEGQEEIAVKVPTTPLEEVAHQIVEVVLGVSDTQWLVNLIKGLVLGQGEADREKKDRAERQEIAKDRCHKLIGCFIEILVSHDEISTNSLTEEQKQKISQKLLATINTLYVFCKACPIFLLNHVEALFPYLKGENHVTREEEGQICFLISEIITSVLPMMTSPDSAMLKEVSKDLIRIIYTFGPSVVQAASKCLATMTSKVTQDTGPMFYLLAQFYGYLYKYVEQPSLENFDQQVRAGCQRGMIVIASLTRHFEFSEWTGSVQDSAPYFLPKALNDPNMRRAVYEMLSKYFQKDLTTQVKALQALGSVFIGCPRLLLLAQEQGQISQALEHPEEKVVVQALQTYREILIAEEERVETGQAREEMMAQGVSIRDQVKGDQDSDSSIVGGTLQIHDGVILRLLFHEQLQIRAAAVQLLGVMLRQGMMHPMETMQYLIALQAEPTVSIKQEALKQLLIEDEKQSTFLSNRLKDGIFLAFRFQLHRFGSSSPLVRVEISEGQERSTTRLQSIFSPIYSSCIQPTRKKRAAFLRQFLSWFDEVKAVEISEALSSKGPIADVTTGGRAKKLNRISKGCISLNLDFLSFISKTIAHLPYTLQDEVLVIIYLINRRISLQGSVLQEELTTLLKNCGIITSTFDDQDVGNPEMNFNPSIQSLDELPLVDHAKIIAKISYGNALCMLLHLKHFLKQWYSLSDEQCQSFAPNDTTKATERGVSFIENMAEFKIPEYKNMDEISISEVISYFQTFKKLMQQDPSDFTLNVKAERPRRGRKPSAPAVPVSITDENTSINGNIDLALVEGEKDAVMDEDFEPANATRRKKRKQSAIAKTSAQKRKEAPSSKNKKKAKKVKKT